MSADVIDQLATLGDLFDRAVEPVSADEVLRRNAHRPTSEAAHGALVEVRKLTANPRHRSWKPRAVGIAASVLVLAAGLALVFHRSNPLAPGTSQTDLPTSTAVSPQTTIDTGPGHVPAGSVLRFSAELPGVGIVNVYDTADQSGVCLIIVEATSDFCDDRATIEGGQSWAYMRFGPDAPTILIGLTATNIGFRVTIGGTTATPDDRGLWYTVVPTGATEFTITTDRGSQVFPINGPGVPTTSTIAELGSGP